MLTDDQLKTKREKTRLRVEKHRARLEAIESASMGLVDCPIEISINDAKKILKEERGLKNLHVIDAVAHQAKKASEILNLPYNEHLIRFGVLQTRLEAVHKKLVREKFASKIISDDQFEYFIHEQMPAMHASGLSPEEWFQEAERQENPLVEKPAEPEKPEESDVLEK